MNSLLKKLNKLYINSPINFSTLTGWRYPQIPRLKGNPILGRLPMLLAEEGVLNNLFAAQQLALTHDSGMCYYWVANKMILLVTQPEHIRQLLIENHSNISRESAYKVFKLFIGSNITVDPAELWKTKKEIYSDWLYKPDILRQHEPKMQIVTEKYLSYLKSNTNQPINLQEFFPKFTLDTLLNTTICPHAANKLDQLLDYQENNLGKLFRFKSIFKWLMPQIIQQLFLRKQLQESAHLKNEIRKKFDEIVLKPNQQELKNTENFINSIYKLTTHQPNDELIHDPNVFGDANMLLVSGQETSVTTLSFAIKLLCANPDIENKFRQELTEHLKDKELTIENINKVHYLDLVLKETLRLFPPVPFLPRDIIKPFKIGEIPLRKGDIVTFSPYVTHRLETIWEQPEKFMPERFDNEKIPHQAFIPFGAGANMCIGQRFAWQELKLLLSAIYLNYHVEIENNNFDLTLAQGSLKPKYPAIAKFVPVIT